jgi:hypothetical protein
LLHQAALKASAGPRFGAAEVQEGFAEIAASASWSTAAGSTRTAWTTTARTTTTRSASGTTARTTATTTIATARSTAARSTATRNASTTARNASTAWATAARATSPRSARSSALLRLLVPFLQLGNLLLRRQLQEIVHFDIALPHSFFHADFKHLPLFAVGQVRGQIAAFLHFFFAR